MDTVIIKDLRDTYVNPVVSNGQFVDLQGIVPKYLETTLDTGNPQILDTYIPISILLII